MGSNTSKITIFKIAKMQVMKAIRLISLLTFLFSFTIANAQIKEIQYTTDNTTKTQPTDTVIQKAIKNIAELLKKNTVIMGPKANNEWRYFGTQKDVSVFEDRIEFQNKTEKIAMYFDNILDYEIS